MKKITLILFLLFTITLFSQKKEVKKPEYVIVLNETIITKKQLEEYAKAGVLKSMNQGITQQERDKLAKKHGAKIGDKEFVVKIELLTEQEINLRNKAANTTEIKKEDTSKKDLKLNINEKAIDFTLQMINGEKIKLSSLKGKVVMVNFWATWCAPCLMEFADIPEKILNPYKNQDFVLLPISIGEKMEKVQKKMTKMKKYGVHFNAGIDPKNEIWNNYASGDIPKNFIIDKKGIIRYISIGNAEGNVDKLASEIKKLLNE